MTAPGAAGVGDWFAGGAVACISGESSDIYRHFTLVEVAMQACSAWTGLSHIFKALTGLCGLRAPYSLNTSPARDQ